MRSSGARSEKEKMSRIIYRLAFAGAFVATGTDAFLRPSMPSMPLSTWAPTAAHRLPSTPQNRYTASQRSLLLSTSVANAAATVPVIASPPSVKAPPDMYQHAVGVGQKKAASPARKTFLMGIISGCHVCTPCNARFATFPRKSSLRIGHRLMFLLLEWVC